MNSPRALAYLLFAVKLMAAWTASVEETPTCSATGTCSDTVLQKLRLSLEWFTNPDHMPLIVASKMGFFAEHGLDVEIIEPDDHFDPLKQIKTGELDVAVTESIHLAQDRAKGEPVLGFGRFLHTDGGVMFLERSGIKRPRDMCQFRDGGRKTRVQYPGAPGLGGLAIVKTMAEADGATCDPAEAVLEPVNEGFYHTNALKEGKADVATLIFYNFEMVEANHLGLNASFFSLKHWGVPDFCQLVFITTKDHFTVKKDELRRMNLAVRKATDWIKMHTSDAKQIYNEWVSANSSDAMNEAILDATLLMFPNEQSMSWDYYDNLEAWLHKTGQISAYIGVRDYWTNEVAL